MLFVQLLGACGPTVGGILIDALGIHQALVIVQAMMVITVIMLFFAGRIYLKYYNKAREEEEERGLGVANA